MSEIEEENLTLDHYEWIFKAFAALFSSVMVMDWIILFVSNKQKSKKKKQNFLMI